MTMFNFQDWGYHICKRQEMKSSNRHCPRHGNGVDREQIWPFLSLIPKLDICLPPHRVLQMGITSIPAPNRDRGSLPAPKIHDHCRKQKIVLGHPKKKKRFWEEGVWGGIFMHRQKLYKKRRTRKYKQIMSKIEYFFLGQVLFLGRRGVWGQLLPND